MAEQKSFFTKTIISSDEEGVPTVLLDDVEVTVYSASGTIATIYEPLTPAITKPNPFTATGGIASFQAIPDYYRVHFADTQIPERISSYDYYWDAISSRDGGTNAEFLEDNSIPGSKLVNSGVTGSKIADGSIDSGHFAPATIVRGGVNPDGTIADGIGFTVSKEATGGYLITFTTAFADTAIVAATPLFTQVGSIDVAAMIVVSPGVSPTATSVYIATIREGVATDLPFHFIAMAQ